MSPCPAPRTEPALPQTDLQSNPALFISLPPALPRLPPALFAFPGSPEHRVCSPASSHHLFDQIFPAELFLTSVGPEGRLIPNPKIPEMLERSGQGVPPALLTLPREGGRDAELLHPKQRTLEGDFWSCEQAGGACRVRMGC